MAPSQAQQRCWTHHADTDIAIGHILCSCWILRELYLLPACGPCDQRGTQLLCLKCYEKQRGCIRKQCSNCRALFLGHGRGDACRQKIRPKWRRWSKQAPVSATSADMRGHLTGARRDAPRLTAPGCEYSCVNCHLKLQFTRGGIRSHAFAEMVPTPGYETMQTGKPRPEFVNRTESLRPHLEPQIDPPPWSHRPPARTV